MTTKEMIRCRKCSLLLENDNGTWFCEECEKNIHDIPDEECPLDEDF